MAYRLASARYRIKELSDIMIAEEISKPEKVKQLSKELVRTSSSTFIFKSPYHGSNC
jgi:hypothetical protein